MTVESKQVTKTESVHEPIRELSAYKTVPFTGPIKLDAMESPYGFTDGLQDELRDVLGTVDVNRYPDPRATELKRRLRETFAIPDQFEITLGNGSDELLLLIQLAVGGFGRTIVAPQPSFSLYELVARYTRADFVGVDLDERFQLPEQEWLDSIRKHNPSCVFFAYPNNPTGNFFDPSLIEATARITEGLVVADEAYYAYSGQSMLPSMQRHSNLVVVRTLSKSGLAGLRIGYMIGHPAWIEELEKLRLPYNVGVLNQASAVFALDNWERLSVATQQIIDERQRVYAALKRMDGLEAYDSETNFIMIRIVEKSADAVFDRLKDQGILLRRLTGWHPLIENCLRISIGTPDENSEVLKKIQQILSDPGTGASGSVD